MQGQVIQSMGLSRPLLGILPLTNCYNCSGFTFNNGRKIGNSMTPLLENAPCPVRIEWPDPKKPKLDPGFEPGPFGQKAKALPLTPPPRPM